MCYTAIRASCASTIARSSTYRWAHGRSYQPKPARADQWRLILPSISSPMPLIRAANAHSFSGWACSIGCPTSSMPHTPHWHSNTRAIPAVVLRHINAAYGELHARLKHEPRVDERVMSSKSDSGTVCSRLFQHAMSVPTASAFTWSMGLSNETTDAIAIHPQDGMRLFSVRAHEVETHSLVCAVGSSNELKPRCRLHSSLPMHTMFS